MELEDVVSDSDVVYPILFLPQKCTKLVPNEDLAENVYIDVNITSPDTEGNNMCVYSGLCCIKIVDTDVNVPRSPASPENSSAIDNDTDQIPIVLSEANQFSFPALNQSHVWIDPSRSPYVYNHYDTSEEHYSIQEGPSCITVEQHNTYITKNIYNYKTPTETVSSFEHKKFGKVQEVNFQSDTSSFDDSGVFLSHLSEEIINQKKHWEVERKNIANSGDDALKQLMSPNIQSGSKQRKTILYLGNNAYSGETIQNISYTDPYITCADVEVDHEVVIDSSEEPHMKKKRYQCDKCKQIFDQISSFRQHMVVGHKHQPLESSLQLMHQCTDCGRTFKSQQRFDNHCLSHGNPELECDICHKVFSSKVSVKAHTKIHNRKYACSYCTRTYDKLIELKRHVEKLHSVYVCEHNNCPFIGKNLDLIKHKKFHRENGMMNDEIDILHDETGLLNNIEIDNLQYDENKTLNDDINSEDFCNKDENDEIKQEKFDSDRNYKGSDKNDDHNKDLEVERIKKADMVIAKVMSNKVFLLNSYKFKRGRFHKTCEVCLKSFDRIGDLKRHLIEHVIRSTLAKTPINLSGTLDILCEVCQIEKFTKIDKYKAHLREHAKLTIYKCTFCDKTFSDSSNFSKHKKIHGNSYFQCDLCQRKFNSKKMISYHMELHKKNPPVKCRYCSKKFHFKSMMSRHVNNTHKMSTSKYKCTFCEEVLTTLKDKWDHEWQVHKVRKIIVDCKICGEKFRKHSQLKRHGFEVHDADLTTTKRILRKKRFTIASYVG